VNHDETGDMTPEEHAEHEEISQIEDFWKWHVAVNAFWGRYYAKD
jgi:hypothetical protein